MNTEQFLIIIHPILAVLGVFPLIGIVSYFAWETRQRRLAVKSGNKSAISPSVGKNHVQIGKILATAVVVVTLVGLFRPLMAKNIIENRLWETDTFQFIFILLMFLGAIATYILLYFAQTKLWRGIFATLSGMAIVILGCQEGIFRRTNEWYISHYYYGITVALLMIFSVAIINDIYRDKTNRWRNIHIIVNCIALLLFIGQGMTGARDLFEIALWTPPPAFLLF
ncbi:DUF4079 domain-containing protein [Cyanobacterium stanieri LEGE 03274]|uniref:DUF4079 domain-containing protein n=1 Tax=Cyanobacterium stanieri LEGE 03274 TaxID=1828756 RepID=A0ABR9V4N2_9CHRO|nr:DUF4079 domain-containing protein [Cyanobacterium stanieri]MBE9222850.1 DUF4079 domain-containing protein [Cyanobacterium stanieri LEGE 03274]